MSHSDQACFDNAQFNQFLENEIDTIEEDRMLAHVAGCSSCQSALEKLAGTDTILHELKCHLVREQSESPGELTQDLSVSNQQRELQKIRDMLAPSDRPDMLGRLGSYEICGVIGRGSAGIVMKALDTRLNRFVAVKMLAPAYSNIGCSRRRFEREGRAIASVKDPHVVPIHTVDEFQGTPYIVMQYIPNGSLLQRIQKVGPLHTNEVVCVGMQIARGLAAAHARGIVHRDVKPANVLLDNGLDGAMVTDFGLARVVDEATVTHSGSISGTPQYMSPEQAKGERVDPKSDLFSLGSVMYAACTGHAPFKSESVFGVIKKVCESEARPIHEFNPDIAPWLVAFIAKLHAKNPLERFESAAEVADLLSQELAHLQDPTMVANPMREWWVSKSKRARRTRLVARVARLAASSIVATLAIALGYFASTGLRFEGPLKNQSASNVDLGANAVQAPNWESQLAIARQRIDHLPRFENSIESSFNVEPGANLCYGPISERLMSRPMTNPLLI
jgi:serine/threonine protein kinase